MLSILSFTTLSGTGGRLFFRQRVHADVRSLGSCRYVDIRCAVSDCRAALRATDWRMAAACCLEPSGRLLVPVGTQIPVSSGLRRFRPTRYCRRLMENLVLDVLEHSEKPPAERSIAVYGREAEVAELLRLLVPLAGRIHVITRRAYALESAVNELARQTGACITLSADMDARGFDLLLAPSGGAGVIATDGAAVFSPDRPFDRSALHISSALPFIPPELDELGSEYDPLELCGAFYELGGMNSLGAARPRCGMSRGTEVSAREICDILDAR